MAAMIPLRRYTVAASSPAVQREISMQPWAPPARMQSVLRCTLQPATAVAYATYCRAAVQVAMQQRYTGGVLLNAPPAGGQHLCGPRRGGCRSSRSHLGAPVGGPGVGLSQPAAAATPLPHLLGHAPAAGGRGVHISRPFPRGAGPCQEGPLPEEPWTAQHPARQPARIVEGFFRTAAAPAAASRAGRTSPMCSSREVRAAGRAQHIRRQSSQDCASCSCGGCSRSCSRWNRQDQAAFAVAGAAGAGSGAEPQLSEDQVPGSAAGGGQGQRVTLTLPVGHACMIAAVLASAQCSLKRQTEKKSRTRAEALQNNRKGWGSWCIRWVCAVTC
jgi:hypothetical protein